MFIDTETGTIVNGPIVFLSDEWQEHLDTLSDSEVIEFALEHGTLVPGSAPTPE